MQISKTQAFTKSSTHNFESIPNFLDNQLGMDFSCPKCNNSLNFQIFFDVELIATNAIIDHSHKRWRIEAPTIGPLKIKEIKCLNCGFFNPVNDFKNKGEKNDSRNR